MLKHEKQNLDYYQNEKSKSNHQNWVPEFRIDKNFKKNLKQKLP